MDTITSWFCINTHCRSLNPLALRLVSPWVDRVHTLGIPRLASDQWIRYRHALTGGYQLSDGLSVRQVDGDLIERIANHQERQSNQVITALRFWEHGISHAYVLMNEADQLMAFCWALLPEQQQLLASLPVWGGLYCPVPADCARLENIYTFADGLRHRGAATELGMAMLERIRQLGYSRVQTHIHVDNLAAHRWARRLGFSPVGRIMRFHLNLRGCRGVYLHVHEECEIHNLRKAVPAQPA